MTRARDISKGDWVKVDGRPVKVTHIAPGQKLGRKVVEISYKHGNRSGMLRPDPDADISMAAVYTRSRK